MVCLQYAFLSPVFEIQAKAFAGFYGCRNEKGGSNRQVNNTCHYEPNDLDNSDICVLENTSP
jgi:hypothetical protein